MHVSSKATFCEIRHIIHTLIESFERVDCKNSKIIPEKVITRTFRWKSHTLKVYFLYTVSLLKIYLIKHIVITIYFQ